MTLVHLDPTSSIPLYRQIYDDLRKAIIAGRLSRGHQLPAARTLAQELDVSRQTVLLALDQLRVEGYVETRERSGTFVSRAFPDDFLSVNPAGPFAASSTRVRAGKGPDFRATVRRAHTARQRSVALPTATEVPRWSSGIPRPFRASLPALDAFPWDVWARLVGRHLRKAGRCFGDYNTPLGYQPLRTAIATYVSAARGVACVAEQVVITHGSRQALDLAARVLTGPGTDVWIEDPCYPGARDAFVAAGAQLVPVPVDADGLQVSEGVRRAPHASAAYVTPSHQYPLGVTMTAPRRLELLHWARTSNAWIIEDDYNSEFRYASRPLAALYGLDDTERVVYIGTFSKTLFPSLRIGYLVVPPSLIDIIAGARMDSERLGPSYEGPLADFIADGHFARHLRRMRLLYQERRNALVRAAQESAASHLTLAVSDAGMHVVGWLPEGLCDRTIAADAATIGLEVLPLSGHTLHHKLQGGLILGFAGFSPPALREGVKQLAAEIERHL